MAGKVAGTVAGGLLVISGAILVYLAKPLAVRLKRRQQKNTGVAADKEAVTEPDSDMLKIKMAGMALLIPGIILLMVLYR